MPDDNQLLLTLAHSPLLTVLCAGAAAWTIIAVLIVWQSQRR
jgi:hypothetical protein